MKKRIDEKIEKFCGVSSGCCACFCRETVFFIGWLVAVVSFCIVVRVKILVTAAFRDIWFFYMVCATILLVVVVRFCVVVCFAVGVASR